MTTPPATKTYKYDVAISLCKQDVDFARKLVKAISPNLKVFFYEDRQEELISKSGPESFARTFREESRIVVILSREEWSNSFYTEIERNAIIDRTAVKNEGYQFLMVIPMVQAETPPWYPTTQIYASPFRFSIEELAHFIEFKITEQGGMVKTLTVEDLYQNFIDRVELKRSIINLQHDAVAIQCARDEMDKLKICFNEKIQFLSQKIADQVSRFEFSAFFNHAHFAYGSFLLECQLSLENGGYTRIFTTQDIWVTFELSKIFKGEEKKPIEAEQRVFYYTPELHGWALPNLNEQASNREMQVLFRNRDNSKFYDLVKPLPTILLVDYWFQRLLSKTTENIARYI